ncbi:MAG TPA: ATP-dependent zinc metalloprotease FtsH [Candidatus Borkfalkia excrementavium]|uniref:ATP-dependent zinc metalloprotease FtsH n=1 Tax=Candidatus Borkfalkia excrementavium TaxID=2838505 RepID=A0A9D2CFQ9_9FIRM|nr:ATP-dependent zinc metalloprotease FtsH [Candidatus Borkfalkia excrementavium]
MSKSSKIVLWTVLGIVLILILVIVLSSVLNSTPEISFTEATDKVAAGEIDEIIVDDYVYRFYQNGRARYTAIGPRGDANNVIYQEFWTAVSQQNVKVSYTDPNAGSYWSYLIPIIGVVLVCVVFWLLIRQTQGGSSKAMSFAKTKARVNSNIKVRFSDVAGAEEEKAELAEVVEFLKAPRKFSDLGARIPKGILLVGPPGTGKTLFAKAVAGEANVPFFSISGSDFVEMFVGVGASRVRDLFDAAKKSQPCIVFIDEIDAVGRQRGTGLGGGHDEREQTLNQLLVQMDGFETNEGIIVMAATNRADILDPALLRPGRFDRQIHVNLPDVRGREQILKVHARNKPLAPDVNFKILSRMTSGFSGADLENLLNEAAILAARANKKMIGNKELFEGINKVLLGPQKKSRLVTESDKRITAYHESGHAIIAKLCKHCDPVQEVSIIARGMAAGYTMTRPDNDDNHMTKEKLTDLVCELLGGRVAEELVIKDVSTGASNDLQRVTEIARKMVTEWGMSERVGLVTYSSDNPIFLGRDMEAHNSYSEETAGIIDEEVHRIIESAHERAVKLLTENRKVLDNMARLLIERETIYTDEVDMLLEGKSLEEINDYMDKKEKSADENPFNRFMKGKDDFKPESVSADPEKAKRGDAGQPKDPGPQDENK